MNLVPFDGELDAPAGGVDRMVPSVAKADVLDRLKVALTTFESNDNPNAVSAKSGTKQLRAYGSRQIQEPTFNDYAKPGESFQNEQHRINASDRKIEADFNYYGGDPAKTLAAYIGGRSGVRPDGSLRDTGGDANGVTPKRYAELILARMNKSGSKGPTITPFDGELDAEPESKLIPFDGELDKPGKTVANPFEGDKPAEKPGFIASAMDSIGTGMNAVRDFATGVKPSGSVLDGVQIPEPQFDSQEAARLSNRAYAERTPIPGTLPASAQSAAPIVGKTIPVNTQGTLGRAGALVGSQLDSYSAGLGYTLGDAATAVGATKLGYNLKGRASNMQDRADITEKSISLSADGAFEKYAPQILAVFPAMGVAAATGAVMPALFGMSQLQSYAEGRKAGLSPGMALGRSVPTATAEVLGEMMGGTGKLIAALENAVVKGGTLASIKELGGKMLASGLREVPSEEATYAMQFGIDKFPGIGLKQNAGLDDFIEGAKDTAIVAAGAGGMMAGGGMAVSRAVGRGQVADPITPIAPILQAGTVDQAITAATAATSTGASAVDGIAAILKNDTPGNTPVATPDVAETQRRILELEKQTAPATPPVEPAPAPTDAGVPTAAAERGSPVPADTAQSVPDAVNGNVQNNAPRENTQTKTQTSEAPAVARTDDAGFAAAGAENRNSRLETDGLTVDNAARVAQTSTDDNSRNQKVQTEAAQPTATDSAPKATDTAQGERASSSGNQSAVEAPSDAINIAGQNGNIQTTATLRPNGTLDIQGDPAEITAQLKAAGFTGIKTKTGVEVGKSQAVEAQKLFTPESDHPSAIQAPSVPQQLGRNNTPLSEGGKPFKTRLAAAEAKKLQPMMRVVKSGTGYVLTEKTAKQLAAESKAATRLRNPNTSASGQPIPAHAFIASEGGLHAETRSDMNMQGNVRIGNRSLFAGAGKGLSIERATDRLKEEGYLPESAGHDEARNLIKRSLKDPQYTPEGFERMAEAEQAARFEDHLAAEQEQEHNDKPEWLDDSLSIPADAELSGYNGLTDPLKLEVDALLSQAQSLGIDAEQIQDAAYDQPFNTVQEYNAIVRDALTHAIEESARSRSDRSDNNGDSQQGRQDAKREGRGRGGEDSGSQGDAEPSGLTAPTKDDILKQQERAKAAGKADAKAKAEQEKQDRIARERKDIASRQDASSENFALGQDANDSISGQENLFGPILDRGINAPAGQRTTDIDRSRFKQFRNALESEPFKIQGFRGLDIETQRVVLLGVLRIAENGKILDSVVSDIPVDVMNVLRREQITPEVLFHDKAMLSGVFSGDGVYGVDIGNRAATDLVRAFARMATKEGFPFNGKGSPSARYDAALPTNNLNAVALENAKAGMSAENNPATGDFGGGSSNGRVALGARKSRHEGIIHVENAPSAGDAPMFSRAPGDHAGNLNLLLRASYDKIASQFPEIKNVTYDFSTGRFNPPISAGLVERARNSGVQGGEGTIKRAVFSGTILSGGLPEGWRDGAESVRKVKGTQLEGSAYERSARARPGLTPAAIKQQLAPTLSRLTVPHAVHTIAQASKETGIDIPPGAKGMFFRGKVHLFSDGVESALDAEAVLFHEAVHAGFDAMYGGRSKEYHAALMDISLKNKNIRDAAKTWLAKYGQDDIKEMIKAGVSPEVAQKRARYQAIDEALAEMSGSNAQISGIKKFIAKVQAIMRAVGLNRLADALEGKSDAEALSLVVRARNAVMSETGAHVDSDGLAAFMRAPIDGAEKDAAIDDQTAPATSASFARGAQANIFQPNIWNTPEPTRADKFIHLLQDSKIDLKRAQEAIKQSGQDIEEKFDARLAETLYPGRVAYRSQQFLATEVKGLLQTMALNRVDMPELSDYLHARGAEERNIQIAKVNPDPAMQDGGAGKNSQGVLMTTQAARDYLSNIPQAKLAALVATARKVDAIINGTKNMLVSEGLEKQETIDAWDAAYKNYVPMFRDEAESALPSHPQGSGFSVKGSSSKRATGSTKEVTNMIAHVLMQREAAITRAEKNHVAMSLYGLALSSPNPEFWTTIRPTMSAAQIGSELVAMGVDPMTAEVGMDGMPTIRTVDPNTNKVIDRPNPMYKNLPGAITVKIGGEDRVLMLNVNNERGLRLAGSLKNLDGLTNLDLAGNIIGKSTRWIASVNTQYNPAFGVVNLVRDAWGGALHLTSTELRGKGTVVLAQALPAMAGIAKELAKPGSTGQWQTLYRQFQEDGGQTGFKDNFRDPEERTKAIESELARMQGAGKLSPGRAVHALFGLLEGFNTSMENAVRLSAYKTALDEGISRKESARLARELTVDFNRKGVAGRELGPLYAFFNAAVQGNARTLQALKGPDGGKIILGGLVLGMGQALMLAAAGYDDDELKEFQKTRGLVIPTNWTGKGPKTHIMIPYPLGLHVLPNTGRVLAELVLNDGKDIGKRAFNAVGEIAGAMSPLGGGNIFTAHGAMTTVLPTLLDPLADIATNQNFAGNPIEKKKFKEEGDNRPGWMRARETTLRSTTGQAYLGISKIINTVTGGNDYEPGLASPTPEMARYIAQVAGGGVLRELEKIIDGSVKSANGEKVKPGNIPLMGRFYGEVDDESVQTSRYYDAKGKIDKAASSADAAKKAGDQGAFEKIRKATPEIEVQNRLSKVQSKIGKLNKLAVTTMDSPSDIKEIDEARAAHIADFNKIIKEVEKQAHPAPTPGERLRMTPAAP